MVGHLRVGSAAITHHQNWLNNGIQTKHSGASIGKGSRTQEKNKYYILILKYFLQILNDEVLLKGTRARTHTLILQSRSGSFSNDIGGNVFMGYQRGGSKSLEWGDKVIWRQLKTDGNMHSIKSGEAGL